MPHRETESGHLGVVACVSPAFCTERWQLVVHMLELYRQYGVDLQVYYLDSILTEILDYINVNAVLHRSVQSLFCRFTCVLTSLE